MSLYTIPDKYGIFFIKNVLNKKYNNLILY